jgi:GAF domain-containing protein
MSNHLPSPQTYRDDFFSYEQWRERFLSVVLRGSCILGFIAILLYLINPATIVLYKVLAAAIWAILVLTTFFTRLPYGFRAGVFLFLLYFAGFSSLIDYGIGDAAILFLGFIVMTSLLFSLRAGIYSAIGLTFLTIVLFGWQGTAFADSARLTAILLVVAAIITIGLYSFQQEFTKTQTAARQTFETLRNERSTLEQRVEERTAGLARKTEQLRTNYIARKTAEVQDLASLLSTVARLVTDQFGFYHTGVFLLNEPGDRVTLHAASSEGGQRMIERGHSLSVGTQGIVGYVAAQKRPRIALDVGEDAVFFNNPDLPMTRSEVALPLLIRNKVLGVLDIQSDKPQAFGAEDIDILQTLSDQIAIAIENARLLDETQATLIQLEALTGRRTREVWGQKLRDNDRVFTYTPLGLRAEKLTRSNENAISAPIILRGQKIGDISVAKRGDAKWSKLDESLLDEVASQVGLAVDNIRLLEDATQRAAQEQTIGKLATRFSQSLDLDTLLQTAARELGQVTDVSEVSVFIGELSEEAPKKPFSKRAVD